MSTIVCLDDLIRPDAWPESELMLDLVRLPIYHATGRVIGKTPHRGAGSNLLEGFSLPHFRALCDRDAAAPSWLSLRHGVPDAAADYLMRHMPQDAMVLGHAMPPWLLGLLDATDTPYVDLRISALRFGADLLVGLRTNRSDLYAAAHAMALTPDSLIADAQLMAARLRLRRRVEGRLRLPENPCIFVGQTEADPELVGTDGRLARATDHADTLRRLAGTGPMMYLPHARAGDFARVERESIERAIGQRLPVCEFDSYDLLACDDELMLLGLNAGLLQEAAWFGRASYALCPLPGAAQFDARFPAAGYLQIAPHVLMGERLWASMFDRPLRIQPLAPAPQPNLLRQLFNDWDHYGVATLRGDEAARTQFVLAGGQRQADALRRCENELMHTRGQLSELQAEVVGLRALVDRLTRQQRTTDTEPAQANGARPRRQTNGTARRAAAAL